MKILNAKVISRNFEYYFSRDIQNTFCAFETSWETDNLESEDKRNIYCELIDWQRDTSKRNENKGNVQVNNITYDNAKIHDYGEDDGINKHKITTNENQTEWWTEIDLKGGNFIDPLSLLSLKELSKNFRSGRIDERIFCNDRIMFGNLMDLNIPLNDSIEIENETYWKRIVLRKIQDSYRLQQLNKNPGSNWKKIGIELLFTEYIEKLEVADVNSPKIRLEIDKLTKKCVDYIENLTIKKVNCKKTKIRNVDNRFINSRYYKNEEVEHISLEFLKPLKNIKHFSITFDSKISFDSKVTTEIYEKRFYQVSIDDISNLSTAFKYFEHLETLEITKTDLSEHQKIFHLLSSIENLKFLKILTLTHCNISSKECGTVFMNYLSKNPSIEELNLKDNAFDENFCLNFSVGIQNFEKIITKLTLSMNHILHGGLEFILKSIAKRDNVINLDISSCDGFKCSSYGTGLGELCKLIKSTKNLQHLNISNNIFTCSVSQRNFVKALEENFSIVNLSFSNCGFSTKDELNIQVLVMRNEYYRHNEILKKDTFTREDELQIEKWLRRVKHPHLMNVKTFLPTENLIKWKNRAKAILCQRPEIDFENFSFFYHEI